MLAVLSFAAWIYLALLRGGFWHMRVEQAPGAVLTAPVAAIIPARDEAAVAGGAVTSLLRQEYDGPLHIFLVDDHSSDGTAAVARAAAEKAALPDRLTVVAAGPLPSGWAGKVWAMAEGVKRAQALDPEYFLLTDADVVHAPDNVGSLIARAGGGYDLVSLMVRLRAVSTAERLLIPAFVYFFFQLYPPAWVRRRDKRTAGAAGGCMLIRADALRRIGGLESIRAEWIDDCAMARGVKRSGGAVWLGLAKDTESIRGYRGFGGIRRMIARTAFTQLRYSAWLLSLTVLGMWLVYAMPILALSAGAAAARLAGAAAYALMMVTYIPVLRYYRVSPLYAPLLPLIALFYTIATIESAVDFRMGKGGQWKGRPRA